MPLLSATYVNPVCNRCGGGLGLRFVVTRRRFDTKIRREAPRGHRDHWSRLYNELTRADEQPIADYPKHPRTPTGACTVGPPGGKRWSAPFKFHPSGLQCLGIAVVVLPVSIYMI